MIFSMLVSRLGEFIALFCTKPVFSRLIHGFCLESELAKEKVAHDIFWDLVRSE